MSNYNKIGIPKPPGLDRTHPFKIDIAKKKGDTIGKPKYTLAVNYHSRLFTGMGRTGKYLQWIKIPITGLDFVQNVPDSFPGENYYCVLKVTVNNLNPESAEIIWISSDKTVNELQPVTFEGGDNLKQTEARIIIGVFVSDDEAAAGLPGNESAVNTAYIMQFINTNLLMCNMIFDGIPVIYPVPFGGGRLNF
jgi:hypothetical protein